MKRVMFAVVLALTLQAMATGQACAEDPPSFLGAWGSDVLISPSGTCVDAQGNVYVADVQACRLIKFRNDGTVLDAVGSPGSGDEEFDGPDDAVVRSDGHVFVADGRGHMREFDAGLNFVTRWTHHGAKRMALDATEQFIYGGLGDSVFKYTTAGTIVERWAFGGNPRFTSVTGIAVGPSGAVYVGNRGEGRVRKYTAEGLFLLEWTGPSGETFAPTGLAVDAQENVYVTQPDRVWKFTSTGELVSQWGTAGSGDGQFAIAADAAIDSDGLIYVVDNGNQRVQVFGYIPIEAQRTTLGRLKARYR